MVRRWRKPVVKKAQEVIAVRSSIRNIRKKTTTKSKKILHAMTTAVRIALYATVL